MGMETIRINGRSCLYKGGRSFFKIMSIKSIHLFIIWCLLILGISAFCLLAYAVGQQDLRQSANDPQIQIAEDTAAALNVGTTITNFSVPKKVDIAKSLAPFIVIYDVQGKVLSATGELHGLVPIIPFGVLQNAKVHGESRVTWQPERGVRIASVTVPFSGGFVTAGRSLREVENREDNIFNLVAAFWLAGVFAVLALGLFFRKIVK
jgi:hypothetical protein